MTNEQLGSDKPRPTTVGEIFGIQPSPEAPRFSDMHRPEAMTREGLRGSVIDRHNNLHHPELRGQRADVVEMQVAIPVLSRRIREAREQEIARGAQGAYAPATHEIEQTQAGVSSLSEYQARRDAIAAQQQADAMTMPGQAEDFVDAA